MKGRFSLLGEAVGLSLQSLHAYKLRSLLTLLGIILAVTTLIGAAAVVGGMKAYISERVASFGADVFYVTRYPWLPDARAYVEATRRNPKLTLEDFFHLQERLTLAAKIAAEARTTAAARATTGSLEETSLRGVTPEMISIAPVPVAAGRYITGEDLRRRALVAFVGAETAEQLFGPRDPLGETLRLAGLPFEVVGVAGRLGTLFGHSQDNFIYVPLTTFLKVWGDGDGRASGLWIGVKCASPAALEATREQARALMRVRRHQSDGQEDAFGLIVSESLTQLWDSILLGLASVAAGVGAIFLFIGGVVIMNIMLASVNERRAEIGLRKALGARRRDILLQFWVEAVALSGLGGLLGVLLATVALEGAALVTSLPLRLPAGGIVAAVGVSGCVGMFFGYYPARQAAQLDPIVALRAE